MFLGPVQWNAKKKPPHPGPRKPCKFIGNTCNSGVSAPLAGFFLAENVTFQAKWWKTIGKTMISDMEAQEPGRDDQGVCGRIPPARMGSHAKTLVKSTFLACPVMVVCISAILPLRRREKCNVSRKPLEIIGKTSKVT